MLLLFTPITPPAQPVITAVKIFETAELPSKPPFIAAPIAQSAIRITAQRKPVISPPRRFILPQIKPDSIAPHPRARREKYPAVYKGNCNEYISSAKSDISRTESPAPITVEKTYVLIR